MDSLTIRPWRTSDDAEALYALVDAVQVQEFGLSLDEDYWRPLQKIEVYFADGTNEPAFWGAWLGERLVGCVGLTRLTVGAGELKRFFVLPECRGHGVANALLFALWRRAVELGFHKVYLGTGHNKPRAIGFYRKHGFEAIPRDLLPPEYQAAPLDDCFFVRRLEPISAQG